MTVIIPDFQLSAATHPRTVVLKVSNLAKVTDFYQQVIGLRLLTRGVTQSFLGVPGNSQPLLILKQINASLTVSRKTGLYHVAFLLPQRKALGNALLFYLQHKAPLIGASDHGYSEALYLTDPEGNGIEVYRDKPRSEWDILPDGEIRGTTSELDATGVIAAADQKWVGFPNETQLGHVHLKVADLDKTEFFYTTILGMSLKNNFGRQAKFFATGDYHHHVGTNIWNGRNLPAMDAGDVGLDYVSFTVENLAELERLGAHLEENNTAFKTIDSTSVALTDPSGIKLKFEV
ncbi:MAG: VOC family protein [Liquorilactobacillus satsumensis]|uniref:VOC family protein n=1 Tax=Liquorilactobacillus satsumensis TaxID=259059 RepID=UPI0039EA0150